eukprot:2087005-Pleurochrysis_carterae.AAC.2
MLGEVRVAVRMDVVACELTTCMRRPQIGRTLETCSWRGLAGRRRHARQKARRGDGKWELQFNSCATWRTRNRPPTYKAH